MRIREILVSNGTSAAVAVVCAVSALLYCAVEADGQVYFLREDVMKAQRMMAGEVPEDMKAGQKTSETDGWLKKMLKQFPEADMDYDGVLGEAEATVWHMQQVFPFPPQGHEFDNMPEGVSHYTVMLEMRDGVKIGTEVYLPAGAGPWPVVLTRTSRGRVDSALDFGDPILESGEFAFVGQDTYPQGYDRRSGRRDVGADGYDTIEWIAAQPWCNGNVGINGYSEAGMTSKSALLKNPPHLKACITSITGLTNDPKYTAGRGRRFRRGRQSGWTPPEALAEPYKGPFEDVAKDLDIPYEDKTGWFDMFTQQAIDEWNLMRHNGKSMLIVGSGAHGPVNPESRKPPAYSDCDIFWSQMPAFKWLTGEVEASDVESVMYYYLMGDCTNPGAPGNVWKVAHEWPPKNTPTSFYLTQQGKLQSSAPKGKGKPMCYTYDPKDPVKAIACMGGGMMDQRPLADRKDMLRFETEPLTEAIEVTGQPELELYVSSDAPDTMFTAQLIDVYPDGWESILLEGMAITRFRDGMEKAKKMKKGKVVKLSLYWISTAHVFDKGHKIRVHMSSSWSGRFEVHPNTWDAIESYDEAKVANNCVHASKDAKSRLILPVVEPGTSADFVSRK